MLYKIYKHKLFLYDCDKPLPLSFYRFTYDCNAFLLVHVQGSVHRHLKETHFRRGGRGKSDDQSCWAAVGGPGGRDVTERRENLLRSNSRLYIFFFQMTFQTFIPLKKIFRSH